MDTPRASLLYDAAVIVAGFVVFLLADGVLRWCSLLTVVGTAIKLWWASREVRKASSPSAISSDGAEDRS